MEPPALEFDAEDYAEMAHDKDFYGPPDPEEFFSSSVIGVAPVHGQSHIDRFIKRNVVLMCNLDTRLYLYTLAPFRMEYNPNKFVAATTRKKTPRTASLIFARGKSVNTGGRHQIITLWSMYETMDQFQRAGLDVNMIESRIENNVYSNYIGFPIDLHSLAADSNAFFNISYNPDIFPGAKYIVHDKKVVFTIFMTGNIVVTGVKVRKDMEDIYRDLKPILERHRVTHDPIVLC
jgi:transcription initiation factor TFIID TATA-box-binding protein